MEIWRAGVPWANIRKQLKMSESTLRNILAFAMKNTILSVQRMQEVEFLQNLVQSMPARLQEVIVRDGGMTRY